MSLKRADLWIMLGLFALSLALRIVFTLGFDGLYGQDPYAYYGFAQELRQAISQHAALTPFFWPLGYPALLAVGFTLFGTTPLTAQAISLVLGSLLAPLVYVLARQVGAGRPGALVAGLIMAACGQAIQSSMVVMADIPALFWATVSAISLIHYLGDQRARWLVIAALTLALAVITRWLYLALIPAWGAAVLLTWRRVRWRETLAAGAAAVLILLPQTAVSIHSPYPVLTHPWVEGWSPANMLQYRFENADGRFIYPTINGLYYAQPYFDPYWIAPLFAPFILLGAWALRRKIPIMVMLLGWALLPYLFLAGIPYQNIRFPLIVVPAVAALAGVGLEALLPRRRIFAPLVIVGLALMLLSDRSLIRLFVANQTTDKNAVSWLTEHVGAGSRVYTFGLTEPIKLYGDYDVHELYDETPDTIAPQLADGKISFLFVNAWVIENQWQGRELQTTYHWLRDTVGLDYLDRIGNYWLFWIQDEDRIPPAGVQFSVG